MFTARLLQRQILREVRSLAPRKLVCLMVLGIYVLGISALPAGPGAMGSGCRCDQHLKDSGNCCCAKKLAGAAKKVSPCCEKRAAKQQADNARSCCSLAGRCGKESSQPAGPMLKSCSCGSPAEAGYLLNTDPRVVAEKSPVHVPDDFSAVVAYLACDWPVCFLDRETPPPRLLRTK